MTNNKQQTAVQWFLDQLIEHRIIIVDKTTYQVKYKHEILLEQAKEMEKEQIKGSWNHGFDWGMMEQSLAEQGAESTLIDAEHYYEQTYG
jgi:hypothetical protein